MPELHGRMHRLTSHREKLPMLPAEGPNFSEISSRRPLPEAPMITLNINAETTNRSPINHNGETRTPMDPEPAKQEVSQTSLENCSHTQDVLLNASYYLQPEPIDTRPRIVYEGHPVLIPVSHQSLIYARAPLYFYPFNLSSNYRF